MRALAIGAAGGIVFNWLTLPLAWMIGAMAFTTVASLAHLNIRLPRQLRDIFATVLGVLLGSQFTLELLGRIGQWATSLCVLALWMVAVAVIGIVYLRRVAGYDPVTAFFSATPGGFNEMVLIGSQMGGDDRTIALSHATRVLLVVFTIPIWYRLGSGVPPGPPRQPIGLGDLPPADLAILALCAVIGFVLGRKLRLPAATLVGPMILSGIAHFVGITKSQPPDVVVSLAQLVLGTAVGCRFAGVPLAQITAVSRHSIVVAVVMLATTILCGWGLSLWTGLPIPAIVLAFAPGGLAEMSLVALALGLDAAFVATHHIFRILVVVTLAPVIFRVTGTGKGPPAKRG